MDGEARGGRTLELDGFLPYRLNRLAHAISRDLQAAYARRHQLTVPEWRTIATLGQFGGLTATAIGRHSAMHKTKVSRAVAALEARRWVARTVNDADRREATVRLTPAGEVAYRDLSGIALAFADRLLGPLPETDRNGIERAITLLEDRLGIDRSAPTG